MADRERDRATDDRTSGTSQEQGDMIDASRATQGASAPPSDGSETRGQQGEGMQDVPEVTGDEQGGSSGGGMRGGAAGEVGRVGQDDPDRGQGGYGGTSGFEGGARGSRDG
jgi:hypothetical protein